MPHSTIPSPGLQALILCGPGVSFNTFTSNPKDLPKALVPIANRPMVWYPLDWCHRMGIANIALITPAECAHALQTALVTHPALTTLPSPKPAIIAPEDLETTTGTGALLRLPAIQKHIIGDFMVLPCDLVSELDGMRLTRDWLMANPAGSLKSQGMHKGGMTVFYPTTGLENISHKKDETDFLATVIPPPPPVPSPQGSIQPNTEELVWVMPTDTLNDKIEADEGFLTIRRSLFEKYPRVKLRTKYRDAHVYIFPFWVKEFIAKNDEFDAICEDIVGSWAKSRWQDEFAKKRGLDEIFAVKKPMKESTDGSLSDDDLDPLDFSTSKTPRSALHPPTTKAAEEKPTESKPIQGLTSTERNRIVEEKRLEKLRRAVPVPQILAYVQPIPSVSTPQPLIRRIDNPHQLLTVSLHLAKHPIEHHLLPEHRIHPTAQVGIQGRIAQDDCLLAENVKVGIRCNIKESVVGANCEIGNNVRLTRCLLMESVHIGDGVHLTGCIIGRRARIEGFKPAPALAAGSAETDAGKGKGKKKAGDDDDSRTTLTDCEVAPNFVISSGYQAKGEKLMAFDTGADDDDDF